jgi:excisionase family DNA binding protein
MADVHRAHCLHEKVRPCLPGQGDNCSVASEETPKTYEVEPRLLTLEDVATYLSVSKPQVYALVRSGELPAIKIGGRGVWRVDRRKLDDYIERMGEETRRWLVSRGRQPEASEPSLKALE